MRKIDGRIRYADRPSSALCLWSNQHKKGFQCENCQIGSQAQAPKIFPADSSWKSELDLSWKLVKFSPYLLELLDELRTEATIRSTKTEVVFGTKSVKFASQHQF